jgi:hypothetical protein
VFYNKSLVSNIRSKLATLSINDLNRLHLKRNTTVLRKAPNKGVEANSGLRLAESGDLDQNILCGFSEFRVLTVDYGRDRPNNSL